MSRRHRSSRTLAGTAWLYARHERYLLASECERTMLNVLVVWLPSLDVCGARVTNVRRRVINYYNFYYWKCGFITFVGTRGWGRNGVGKGYNKNMNRSDRERNQTHAINYYFETDSQLFSLNVNLNFSLIEKWARLNGKKLR